MKSHSFVLSLFTVLALAFAGCEKGATKIDTSAIEKSFSSGEAGLKDAAMKAVEAVKKADYAGALKELQGLAANAKLSDDQKSAINGLVEQVKKALADAGAKAAEGASKAMGDAQKAVGK
jgi:hypothetical protein